MSESSLPIPLIKKCFLMNNYKDEVLNRGFKRRYSDPELFEFTISFIRDICGVEVDVKSVNDPLWYKVIFKQVVSPILKGKVSTREKTVSEASIVTPATAIYYAVFQLYGHEAPKRMYEILEPVLVSRLSGTENDAELLFYPVLESYLERQIAITKEVLKREPRICNVPLFVHVFCSKTKRLSKSLSKRCVSLLSEVCGEVIKNG